MLDPAQSKHWRFARQSGLRPNDFADDGPRGLTFGDALVFVVAVVIAAWLFL